MDQPLEVDVLQARDQLFEVKVDKLSVNFVFGVVQELSQSVACAVVHLDHDVESDEVLALLNEFVH